MAKEIKRKPKIKIVQFSFIQYRLSRMNFSQTFVARMIGCTPEMVNQIMKGTRNSGNIQQKLAALLGYRSWNELEIAAYYWDAKIHEEENKWRLADVQ